MRCFVEWTLVILLVVIRGCTESMSKNDESVKVVVRIRPMSADEERNGNTM